MRRSLRLLLALPLATALSACAVGGEVRGAAESPATADATAAGDRVERASLVLAGRSYVAQWYLPAAAPTAFIQVQHGFSRRCPNLLDTTREFMAQGLMAMCLNADMSGGNPALADALAAALVAGLVAPDGRPVPERLIVGGHSAGGQFASRLGQQLALLAPQRLAGAVLFDPVAADGSFTTNLQAISAAGQRPVLAVSANPGPCNASNNAYPALRQVQADARAAGADGFVGAQLTAHSTHVDAEGRNSDLLAWTACLQGKPRTANTDRLQELSRTWARDLATGTHTAADYPGGSYFDALVQAGQAQAIE